MTLMTKFTIERFRQFDAPVEVLLTPDSVVASRKGRKPK
jgi:hypothetical protein